jgi:hypothetical protein
MMEKALAIYATNYGLFLSNETDTSTTSTATPAVFTRVSTGQTAIDSPANALSEYFLSSSSSCYGSLQRYIYVSYPGTTGAAQTALTYTTLNDLSSGTAWKGPIEASSIPGFNTAHRFNFATHDHSSKLNMYLIGQSSANCGTVNCVSTASVVLHNTSTTSNAFTTSFTFPASFLVVGLEFHANGLDLYAYGSELWHSVDGGYNFVQLYILNNVVNSVTEVYKGIRSSVASESYGLLTNFNRVFFGKVSSASLIPIRSFSAASTQLVDLLVDDSGTLDVLTVEAAVTYPANAALYPIGFLKTSQGDLRTIDDSFLKKIPIPTRSLIPTADESFDVNLVPIFIGNTTVQFYAHTDTQSGTFLKRHEGYQIRTLKGGSAIITGVSDNGRLTNCSVISPFLAETETDSSALLLSLTLPSTTLGDMTAPTITETPPLTVITLTLSGSATGGWQASDVGKTVVANQASIVITSITSVTSASGKVIRPPLAVGNLAPGSWYMYDFRAYIEYATTPTQGVTVGSTSGNLATVTLANPGIMSFTKDGMDLTLKTE